MNKLIKKIKKIETAKIIKYIPIILLITYSFIIHLKISATWGDDLFFANQKGNLIEILTNRYYNWTSRILIETVLISILAHASFLWKIIDALMLLLISYSLNKVFNQKKSSFINMMIVLLLIIYPYSQMNSAGWGATTINYLWPLALALFALIPIMNEVRKNDYNKIGLLAYFPAFIFAINQEQLSVLYLGFLIIFNFYVYVTNKKINKLLFFYLIMNIIAIIFILKCPGNMIRLREETLTWFKDYNQLTVIDKIGLSLNNTFELVIGKTNYLFILMYSSITYYLLKNSKHKSLKIISILSLLGTVIIPHFDLFTMNDIYNKNIWILNEMLKVLPISQIEYLFSIVLSILYLVNTIFLLSVIFKENNYLRIFVPIIFLAGILSRMIIGFSPTLYISSTRTAIFMFFSFIMITIIILNRSKLNMLEKRGIILYTILILLLAKFFTVTFNIRL